MSYTESFTKALGKIEQPEPEIEALVAPEFEAPDVGILDKLKSGQVATKLTRDEDLKAIASKHGISLDKARNMATLLGGAREWADDEDAADMIGDSLLSLVGVANTAGLQVPGWIAKKMSDEKTQLAYDDIRKLVDSNKGLGQTLAEGLLPIAGAGKAAGVGSKILASSAVGAASGLAGSDVGNELAGAAMGATISGTLTGAFDPQTIRKITSTPVFKKVVEKFNNSQTVVDTLDAFKSLLGKESKKVNEALNKSAQASKAVDDFVTKESSMNQDTLFELADNYDTLLNFFADGRKGLKEGVDRLETLLRGEETLDKMVSRIGLDLDDWQMEKIGGKINKMIETRKLLGEDQYSKLQPLMEEAKKSYLDWVNAKAGGNKLIQAKMHQMNTRDPELVPGSSVGAVGGWNLGTSKTAVLKEAESGGRPVELHEFMHRMFSETAKMARIKSPKLEEAVQREFDISKVLMPDMADGIKAYAKDQGVKDVAGSLDSWARDKKFWNYLEDFMRNEEVSDDVIEAAMLSAPTKIKRYTKQYDADATRWVASALEEKARSFYKPETDAFVSKFISQYYKPEQTSTEFTSWVLTLLNNEADRKEFKKIAGEGADAAFSDMKSGIKKFRRWAENASVDDIVDVRLGSGVQGGEAISKSINLNNADNFFSDITPDVLNKLEGMKVRDLVKEIPGLEISRGKKSGLEVFDVVYNGENLGSAMSEEGARTKVLKWLKEMKNRSEVDFKRY